MSSNPPLVAIGDITCTQDQVITPSGSRPIGEVNWTFTNLAHTWQTIPTWAVVVAVVGATFTCFLSLLFLLVKEDKTQGWVHVTVQAPGFMHVTQLPVYEAREVTDFAARVDYARSLSAGRAQS